MKINRTCQLVVLSFTVLSFVFSFNPDRIFSIDNYAEIEKFIQDTYSLEDDVRSDFERKLELLPMESQADIERIQNVYSSSADLAKKPGDSEKSKYFANIASIVGLKLVDAYGEEDFYIGRCARKEPRLSQLIKIRGQPAIRDAIRRVMYNQILPKELRAEYKNKRRRTR